MTDVKVLSNRESLTKYTIELFYKGFTDLENKYLFDLYDIDDDDDFRLSSFETGSKVTINQSFLLKLTTTKMSRVNGKKEAGRRIGRENTSNRIERGRDSHT
ncbi:unnamed protein product [Rhizophagus irregularis]|uniref:Uncharacterized protein n=1 Tax=Rhizophagus irregularis TaxID=588596 RepID=A0A915ZFK2_9GLOM|nr:unnamed protein product [Rhizophagus irregularis]